MDKDHYISLIFKKLKGGISLEDQSSLDMWLGDDPENEQLLKELEEDWSMSAKYEQNVDIDLDIEGDFNLLQQRIQRDNVRIAHQPAAKVLQVASKKKSIRWINWAAAAVVLLAIGFWFYNQNNTTETPLLALQTQFGEKKEVQLADGTKIVLNGNSQLHYPSAFSEEQRLVKLTGEAFFDVAKNTERPFIIETKDINVRVLGTSFNVRAKLEESTTEVAVRTGKVRLESKNNSKKIELIAKQKGLYNKQTASFDAIQTHMGNDLAWHSGVIVFYNTPLADVVKDLSQQFEVKIELKNSNLSSCEYGGRHKTEDGIENILKAVAAEFEMELKVLGETSFQLNGGDCQ